MQGVLREITRGMGFLCRGNERAGLGEGRGSRPRGRSLKFFIQAGRRHYSTHTLVDTGLKPHSPRRPGVLLSDDTPVNNSPGAHTAMTPGGREIVIPRLPHKTGLRPLFSSNQKFISAYCAPLPRNLDLGDYTGLYGHVL